MAKKTQKLSQREIILLIVIMVLIVAVGIILTMLLTKENEPKNTASTEPTVSTISTEPTAPNVGLIKYDEAAVAFGEEELSSKMEEMQNKVEDGKMALRYQKIARSSDGVNFKCQIGNSPANNYDMYINIYKDPELTEQILLTGLISPGSEITEFESEIPLESGTYSATLVLTQVEDDHSTFHAQLMVVLDLVVE